MKKLVTESSATFSPCRKYRYELWRRWDAFLPDTGYAMFTGLNPSTANEVDNDNTIRRCISFAQSFGCSALCMTNIFGFAATDPHVMMAEADPIGPDNDEHLVRLASKAKIVIAAWGIYGRHLGRGEQVKAMLPNLHVLSINKDGSPGHPLYLRKDSKATPWASLPPLCSAQGVECL